MSGRMGLAHAGKCRLPGAALRLLTGVICGQGKPPARHAGQVTQRQSEAGQRNHGVTGCHPERTFLGEIGHSDNNERQQIMAKYPGPNKRRSGARRKKGTPRSSRGKHSGSYARLKHDMQQRGKWHAKK